MSGAVTLGEGDAPPTWADVPPETVVPIYPLPRVYKADPAPGQTDADVNNTTGQPLPPEGETP